MSKARWFLVALVAAGIFAFAGYQLFADNKVEVITMAVSGAVAILAANASGKVKIKEITSPNRK
jgi:hypothetical protein